MAQLSTVRTVVGVVGNLISLGLFMSPVPTFASICKKKDVEQFSSFPYLATLLNCLLWCLYGLPVVHPDSTLVLTINGAGVVVELCYLVIYILYSPAKQKLNVILSIIAEVIVVVAIGAFVICFVHNEHTRSTIVGILCIVFCIIMYVAPLAAMKLVITTKSVEFMPLYLSVASFLNGACWTAYSLLKFDINILVPNGIGLLFTIVQLVLYAMYYRSTQRILRERKKGDIDMSDVKKIDNQS